MICTTQRNQLGMRPNLGDFPVVEDADNVSILDRTEAMSNSKCNPVADFGGLVQGVLNNLLAFRV